MAALEHPLISIQASYLAFRSPTRKPLNNGKKHKQEEGCVPNTRAWFPPPPPLARILIPWPLHIWLASTSAFILGQWIMFHIVKWNWLQQMKDYITIHQDLQIGIFLNKPKQRSICRKEIKPRPMFLVSIHSKFIHQKPNFRKVIAMEIYYANDVNTIHCSYLFQSRVATF